MTHFPMVLSTIVCLAASALVGERTGQPTVTALHDAIKKKDLAAVKAALRQDRSNVNARDDEGATPLHVAARLDQRAIVEVLLDHGADPRAGDRKGRTPLTLCTIFNLYRRDAAAALVASRAEDALGPGERARLLHRAVRHGDEVVARALIGRGIDLRTPNENGGTLLHSAAAGGLVGLATELLAQRFGVDERDRYGMTPLHNAAACGHAAMAETLLRAGARIDAVDRGGRRPLAVAVLYGRAEVAGLLRARNDADLATTVHWHGLCLDNRYDGTHQTQAPIPVGKTFPSRWRLVRGVADLTCSLWPGRRHLCDGGTHRPVNERAQGTESAFRRLAGERLSWHVLGSLT